MQTRLGAGPGADAREPTPELLEARICGLAHGGAEVEERVEHDVGQTEAVPGDVVTALEPTVEPLEVLARDRLEVVREANNNYGQQLIIWDIVFGTRFLPADRMPPEVIGMANLDAFPMTYLAQVASPFRWSRIKRESAELAGAGT